MELVINYGLYLFFNTGLRKRKEGHTDPFIHLHTYIHTYIQTDRA
jgi:hypothetical protein